MALDNMAAQGAIPAGPPSGTLISIALAGGQFPDTTSASEISAANRFVVVNQIFPPHGYVHDIATGLTRRIVVTPNGVLGGVGSASDDLVPDDTNGVTDAFVHRPSTLSLDGSPSTGNPIQFRIADGDASEALADRANARSSTLIPARALPKARDLGMFDRRGQEREHLALRQTSASCECADHTRFRSPAV